MSEGKRERETEPEKVYASATLVAGALAVAYVLSFPGYGYIGLVAVPLIIVALYLERRENRSVETRK